MNIEEYNLFDGNQYVANYEDLSAITNKQDAWKHWIYHGKSEGRLTNDIYKEELNEYNNGLDFLNINNIYFKQKYDNYGVHLFGWKNVINNYISWFTNTKEQKYKYKLLFDEWIEKLLIWGNKKINVKYLDDIFTDKYDIITFIHNPPFLLWNDETKRNKISTEMIVNNSSQFNENVFNIMNNNNLKERIVLLYTLSNDHKQYLLNTYPEYKNKIVSIHHPIDMDTCDAKCFSIDAFLNNKKIYNIGWWLRNFKTFVDFSPSSNFDKIILVKDDFLKSFEKAIVSNNDLSSVKIITQMTNEEYSNIFKDSCIFADIIDCIANNTVLECIKFNTPIILRRSKSAEEYLGCNYPLFFNDINELTLFQEESFLLDLIVTAHKYLKNMNKSFLSLDTFNMKLQYDLDKLAITNSENKLTWVFIVHDDNVINIKTVINNFILQKNQNNIKLLIIIHEQYQLSSIVNDIICNYDNINVLETRTIFTDVSLIEQFYIIQSQIDTSYVTFVNSEAKFHDCFSIKAIQKMNKMHNCDIGISSFIQKNKNSKKKVKNIFKKGDFFFYEIENINLDIICIVLRTSIFRFLLKNNWKENMNTTNFLLHCLDNNLNIRCISEDPLFSIL